MIWITLQESPVMERNFERSSGQVEVAPWSTTNHQSDLEQAIMASGILFSPI